MPFHWSNESCRNRKDKARMAPHWNLSGGRHDRISKWRPSQNLKPPLGILFV